MSESEGFVLQTAPFDARFPNTNQSKACFQNYVDHYRCINKKGEDFEPCKRASCPMKSRRARRAIDRSFVPRASDPRRPARRSHELSLRHVLIVGIPVCPSQFYRTFHSLCPNEWIAKWDEQREAGKFPARLE